MLQSTEAFFDREAAQWTSRYARDKRFARRFSKITSFVSKYLPQRPFTALDIGCGSGVFSRWLAVKGATVMGIDVSPEMIAEARRETTIGSAHFTPSSLDEFDNLSTFDVVLALSMLEYVESTGKSLDKIADLSRDLIVLSVPNRIGMVRRFERAAIIVRRLSRGVLFRSRGTYLTYQRKQWRAEEIDRELLSRGFLRVTHMYVGTSIAFPTLLLPLFERRWWAALYCAAYRRTTAPAERSGRA
jgi:2-polyprenyl-3-methyl-5-hydroxy-6-metoxy-1,4-benzoquinol methylase